MAVYNYNAQDECLVNNFIREYSERLYQVYPLYTIDDSTAVDSLYNEAVTKVYKLVGRFYMYAETQPEMDNLTKYGLDRTRDIVFHLPRLMSYIQRDPFIPYVPKLQDVIDFKGIKYQVLHIIEDKWFVQTDRNLFYTLFADKLQETDRCEFLE